MNRLSVGMTKQEVIGAMGEPQSSAAPGGGIEMLRYHLADNSDAALLGNYTEYYVKLVEGKVDSYGRMGDFNSTKDPTYNINVDQTVRNR